MSEVLEQVLDYQRRAVEATAQRVQPIEEGWVIRTSRWPEVWSHNQVWVNRPISGERAVELCREHLHDGLFWQLYLEPGAVAGGLPEELAGWGWEIDREVHMVLRRGPGRQVSSGAVVEPTEEESLSLMARWMREDATLDVTEAGVRQLVEKDRAVWRSCRARRFGVRAEDGRVVAITQLFSDRALAQVEDVYVAPEARGRGFARTLVSHAVAEAGRAGHDLVFIVADDNDWPKELYGRIGFEPVGLAWLCHLPPAALAAIRSGA